MNALGAAVLGIGLLTACSTAQTSGCGDVSQNGTGPSAYSLGSGDRLQVVVFRHPDLSGQFSLDGEGYVALPLAGEIAAGDLTTRQLEDEIESRLKGGGFLISPQVSVQLVTYRSFYVLGEVGTPGSYEYRNGITVIARRRPCGRLYRPRRSIERDDRARRLPFRYASRYVGQSGRHHHHCRAVLLIEARAWPAICRIRTTGKKLRHQWLTQISGADHGIG